MSVITNKLSNSIESYLLNNSDSKNLNESNSDQSVNSNSNNGNYYIMDYEPTGSITNTSAVSIPNSSKYRRNQRIRLNSLNSPSPSGLSISTTNGSLSHQNLKESLNKTLSSLMENCQEKVIIYNSSPSSSYSFTKHSTIIYSPTKKSSLSSSTTKTNLSQNNNIFSINKIKPSSLKKESKLSEITFGLNKEKLSNLKKSSSSDDITKLVDTKLINEQEKKTSEEKEVTSPIEKKDDLKEKVETEIATESTVEVKSETIVNSETNVSEKNASNETKDNSETKIKDKSKTEIKDKKSDKKSNSKSESLAKLEAKRDKELLKRKNGNTHKKTLSLPNILAPLTPLSAMNETEPQPEKRKRRKSVNFSTDSFKSICIFTTTDKPESIRDSKIEVKTDDPENEKKDKDFSELRNYESAWSPVPRNVIHTQKFKSSKAKHSHYELPVSVQSFKLVQGSPEETEDKLTCLEVTLNVQNLNYEKKVVIRYTVNKWKFFEEVEAKYEKCIREATKDEGDDKGVVGLDCFVARIPVGKYFVLDEKPGHICNQRPTKMLLVARYEVNNNTYWDNNDFTDYHIELVRINAGYDVPRVSKNGKPIPCPGCSISAKQSTIIEKKGKEIKNNKRTVRKIGGVYGNFTEAVTNNNDRTNFMADKKKVNLYMGMDGNQKSSISSQSGSKMSMTSTTTSSSSKANSTGPKVAPVLTEEPKSIVGYEEKAKSVKKTKGSKDNIMNSSYSYNFGGSPSLGGSPMFSMLGNYSPLDSTKNNSTTTTTNATTNATPSYATSYTTPSSTSSKYNPPMSTTSSFSSMPSTTATTTSSYNPSTYSYSFDRNAPSKYELSPYSGGLSYDPSVYGHYPSNGSTSSSTSSTLTNPADDTTTTTLTSPTTPTSYSSKYNPPNEYPGSSFSKYDPPSYYNKTSYSTPLPSSTATTIPSSSSYSSYDREHYGSPSYSSLTKTMNNNFSHFSDYNFGTNLVKKAKKVTGPSMDYSNYSAIQKSKYDIPFSTFSSFGDNFSNYYSMSPSAVTY